jgi:hypothetical protein
MTIASTLAEMREFLSKNGVEQPEVSLAVRDQLMAGFRADLLSLGVDPADETIAEPVLAGFTVGLKVLIQQQVDFRLLVYYTTLCEILLPLLDGDVADVSDLPSLESDALCSMCGANPVVLNTDTGLGLCAECVKTALRGATEAMRLAGVVRPQVGGPGFNRGSEEPVAERRKSWRDRTLSELFARGKHRRTR